MTSWYGGINSYFGSLVLWQILSTNNETTSILYRPNEVQKLDVGLSLEAVFVHKNDSLYYKLRYNVVSLATLAQWHWVKKVGVKKSQFSGRQLQMSQRLWVLKGSIFHFAPKCFQNGRKLQKKTAQNEPKLRESCAP